MMHVKIDFLIVDHFVRIYQLNLTIFIFTVERPINVKSRPRLPIPDEDPYYIPGTVMTRITDSSDSGYGGISNSNRGGNNAADSSGICCCK